MEGELTRENSQKLHRVMEDKNKKKIAISATLIVHHNILFILYQVDSQKLEFIYIKSHYHQNISVSHWP